MNDRDQFVCAVDIGGTKIAAAIGTADGKMLARYQTATHKDPTAGVDWIVSVIQDWHVTEKPGAKIRGLGVGCPGPLDRTGGMILKAPNLGTWNEYPLRQELTNRLSLPVELENDANLAAIGEHRYGAGCGCQDLVYVTVSTGIGGGLVIHDELVRGLDDSAGEIGHMTIDPHGPACNCGSRGCLEAMASGTAIMDAAHTMISVGNASEAMSEAYRKKGALTARDIAELAEKGDTVAASILDEAMISLGIGISNLITVLSPQIVVIGGGVSNIGERMFKTVRKQVQERVKLVPAEKIAIVPAKLGGDSTLYGGFFLAAGICQILSEE
jgi:glucokinase